MIYRLIAVAVIGIAGFAQEAAKPPEPKTDPKAGPKTESVMVRRLESITWNPVSSELSWIVSNWNPDQSMQQPISKDTYTMRVDAAVMQFGSERRRFDSDEAKNVRGVMDLIAVYAIESTVWWDQGLGDKVPEGSQKDSTGGEKDKQQKDEKPKADPKASPVKVGPFAFAAPPVTHRRESN
jgi:hypothetical protein